MQTPIRLWLGTDHMLLVAAVDGLLYAVPVAGAWVASITAGVVGYVSADGNPWLAAIVMVVLIQVVNGVFDQVVSPKIAGEKVGLHPLVVIFSVLAGATLLGFVGMLVAVPTAAAIKIAIDTFMPEVLAKEREDAAEAGT
jgi:predicted PurR-regulated permease PerM